MDLAGREGSLQGPTSQESDGGIATPLSGGDAAQNRSDSSGTSTGSNTGEVPAAGAGHASAASNVGAAGGSSGGGGGNGSGARPPAEPEFVSMNGPRPPIAEHNTHSEMNSETTSSMGDGSRMGGASAGISPTLPVRPSSGSTLNPNLHPAAAAAPMGDSVAAESSQLDPASASVASLGGSSALVVPVAAGAAAAAAAHAHPEHAEEQDSFHTFSVNSWGDSMGREGETVASDVAQAALHPPSDHMGSIAASHASSEGRSAVGSSRGVHSGMSSVGAGTTSSTSQPAAPSQFGAASYPRLTPSATGPGGAAPAGESGPLERNLTSITQLGSIGILADQGSQSNPTEVDPENSGAVLPSSQASSGELAVRSCRLEQLCTIPAGFLYLTPKNSPVAGGT